MTFLFKPIDEASVYIITGWRYEPPYDVYNLPHPPDATDLQYFLDPLNAFYCITDETDDVLAFCSFGPDGQVPGGDYSRLALDIGLGIRPDLTGRGRGSTFVKTVLDFARRTFAPPMSRVTVAEFNQRALRVWVKAGFRRVQIFREMGNRQNFIVLIRAA